MVNFNIFFFLLDIDQQQYEMTQHSTIITHLLDFVDYCNEVIDIHPSTTPQYKCAVKVNANGSLE